MKKLSLSAVFILIAGFIFYSSASAMDMHGDKVHMSHVDGHDFMYSMIDMGKKAEKSGLSKNMDGMYHLMVHVKKGDKFVEGAKTAFVVKGPDGKVQKAMAMEMSKGYGADIKMKKKGMYEIKVKTMKDGKAMMDTFKYEKK